MKQLIIRSLYAKPSSGLELILVSNEDLKYTDIFVYSKEELDLPGFVKIGQRSYKNGTIYCYVRVEHKDPISAILGVERTLSKAYKSLINNR